MHDILLRFDTASHVPVAAFKAAARQLSGGAPVITVLDEGCGGLTAAADCPPATDPSPPQVPAGHSSHAHDSGPGPCSCVDPDRRFLRLTAATG